MLIRRERPDDVPAVQALHDLAFGPIRPPTPDGVTVEATILAALRADAAAWLPALSLVATAPGSDEPLGHVVCSRAWIDGEVPVLGLGPIAVLPQEQRRGAGSALVHAVLAAADALGEPLVALLGDPVYYGRFGFVPAAGLGVTAPDPAWGTYFQARSLSAYEPLVQRGAFAYAPAFDLD